MECHLFGLEFLMFFLYCIVSQSFILKLWIEKPSKVGKVTHQMQNLWWDSRIQQNKQEEQCQHLMQCVGVGVTCHSFPT